MYKINKFNLEKLILFHLYQSNLLNKVRLFPYIMYSIRSSNGTTRWSKGIFNEELQVFIKYPKEFNSTKLIKKTFDFYERETKHLNKLKKLKRNKKFYKIFYRVIINKIDYKSIIVENNKFKANI
jgi:hypothetical protein